MVGPRWFFFYGGFYMLKVNRTINLNASSVINNQVVVYMSATLSTDGQTSENINKNIYSQELYELNKEEIRQDMRDFEEMIYKEQDSLFENINSRKKY